MERWAGKVAIVTGASSGIGEAIAVSLVKHGLKVLGLARRMENLHKITTRLQNAKGFFFPMKCDVSKEEDILGAFVFAETLGGVDILVNNAGVAYSEYVIDSTTEHMKNILDVNVLAAAICIREAAKSMREHNKQGHIININSVLGVIGSKTNGPISLYQPSKCALSALSEVIRNELAVVKANIKVTNLAPGMVKTEMPQKLSSVGDHIFEMYPHLECKDITDAVIYILGTPPNVQVKEMTITALNEDIFKKLER